MCQACVPELGEVGKGQLDECKFLCIRCNERGAVFYVSFKPTPFTKLIRGFRGFINRMVNRYSQTG